MEEHIVAFLMFKAGHTARQYRAILSDWSNYLLKKNIEWMAANELEARTFLGTQAERPGQVIRGSALSKVCLSTVRRKAVILKAFYDSIPPHALKHENPFARLVRNMPQRFECQRRPTVALTNSEVQAIIKASGSHTITGIRDRAFMAVMFGGGLRISEVCGLKIGDVLADPDGTIFLRLCMTKAQEAQEQVLPQWAAEALLELVHLRQKQKAHNLRPLFVLWQGEDRRSEKELNVRTARRLFKRIAANAGLGPDVTPHSARATAITRLRELHLDTKQIQSFSRHKTSRMIDLYDKRRWSRADAIAKKLDFTE